MKSRKCFILCLCTVVLLSSTGCNSSRIANTSDSNIPSSYAKSSLSPEIETESGALGASVKSSPTSGSSNSKVEEFLNSTEGIDFQAVAKEFTIAYYSGDVQTMKIYLLDPKSIDNYLSTKNRLGDIELLNLKLGPEDIKDNSVHAQYEISMKDDGGNVYLDLKMKRVNNNWKVSSYWLEQ